METFFYIYAGSYLFRKRREGNFFSKDRLFGFEEARKVFWKFWKHLVSSSDESSLGALYRFDTFITQPVNSFVGTPEAVGGYAETI